MTNQTQNLFIVEDNQHNALKLHQFLQKRFGTIYNVSTFTNAVDALSKVDKNTSIVVLDYGYFGEEGTKILNFIKLINPETKVIILSSTDQATVDLEKHLIDGDKFLTKDKEVKKKLQTSIFEILSYPANYLQARYSLSQAFIYSVFVFIVFSIIVFLGMQNF
jgi:CheY-like chemotaxis protein